MSCADFESRLAEILAGESAEATRHETLLALRAHAEDCPECAGCLDLIDLAQLPAGDRDLVDVAAPAEYWSTFNQRVRRRIAGSSHRPGHRAVWGAAAAILIVTAAGLGLYSWAPWSAERRSPGVQGPIVAQGDRPAPPDAELPGPLDDLLSRVPPEQALAELELIGGIDESWTDDWDAGATTDEGTTPAAAAWPFPDTDSLDDDARKRLLEWLLEQNDTEKRVRS